MYIFKFYLLLLMLLFLSSGAVAQNISKENTKLIGSCQGCKAVLDYEDQELSPTDTLPEFQETEPKLKITGTVYKSDGETPAKGVVIFIHQTNREGVYPKQGDEKGWARNYGYIHGWVKTGADGKYTFYTFKPGSYSSNPAHIHPIILEPNGKYYWLGSFFFSGDPNLTDEHRNPESPRGGSSGVLSLKKENGILVGKRDFILGKNVPGYE